VKDSAVPEREVSVVSCIESGHAHLTLQDTEEKRIALTVIMSYREAYNLATELLSLVGGFYGVKDVN
jgi:hypothetical protein